MALGSDLLSSYHERQVKKSRKSGKEDQRAEAPKEEAKEVEELECSPCGHGWSWTRIIKIVLFSEKQNKRCATGNDRDVLSRLSIKAKSSAELSNVQSAPLRDHQKSTQAGSNRTLASPFWDGVGVPRGEFLATTRCQEEELEQRRRRNHQMFSRRPFGQLNGQSEAKDVGGTIRRSVGAPSGPSEVHAGRFQ